MRLMNLILAGLAATALVAADPVAIKAGYLPVTGHAKYFIARDQGFFTQEGLAVELVEFANSADGLAAVRAGKLDVGAFGTTAPLVHISKGADLRIIGGIMGEDAAIIVKADKAATVKTVADLKGLRIATVRLATGDAVLRGALSRAGLDWRKDVTLSELKNPPAVIEAVKSGEVDAGAVWGPHDLRAEAQGLAVVIRSGALQPGHPCCRLVVQAETLKQQPATWTKFLRAILLAERFAAEHHPETIAILAKQLKLAPELVEKAYYRGYLEQGSDPNVSGIVQFWNTMKASAFVDSQLDIRSFINVDPYHQALESLQAAQPGDAFWKVRLEQFAQRDQLAAVPAPARDGTVLAQAVNASDLPPCCR